MLRVDLPSSLNRTRIELFDDNPISHESKELLRVQMPPPLARATAMELRRIQRLRTEQQKARPRSRRRSMGAENCELPMLKARSWDNLGEPSPVLAKAPARSKSNDFCPVMPRRSSIEFIAAEVSSKQSPSSPGILDKKPDMLMRRVQSVDVMPKMPRRSSTSMVSSTERCHQQPAMMSSKGTNVDSQPDMPRKTLASVPSKTIMCPAQA